MSVIKGCLKEESKELKKLVMMYWEVVKKYDADGKLLPEMILVCVCLVCDVMRLLRSSDCCLVPRRIAVIYQMKKNLRWLEDLPSKGNLHPVALACFIVPAFTTICKHVNYRNVPPSLRPPPPLARCATPCVTT